MGVATTIAQVRFMHAAAIARQDTAIGLGIEFIVLGTRADLDIATGLGTADQDTEAATGLGNVD